MARAEFRSQLAYDERFKNLLSYQSKKNLCFVLGGKINTQISIGAIKQQAFVLSSHKRQLSVM